MRPRQWAINFQQSKGTKPQYLSLEMLLVILEMVLMSLGVGLEQELEDEFEGDVDEFDEFGGAIC